MEKNYSKIIDFFRRNGFGTVPYLLKILSYLPPADRCRILTSLIVNDPTNVTIYDKLSMAYLKNGQYDNGIKILDDGYRSGYLNPTYYHQLKEKIQFMHQNQGNNFGSTQNYQATLKLLEDDYRDINGGGGANWDASSVQSFNEFYKIMKELCLS